MGNAYGKKWNDKLIENAIWDVVSEGKLTSFPTHKQMDEITGSRALSNAVSKNGGTNHWAEKLGLDTKPCESKFGEEYELKCKEYIEGLGYRCQKAPVRYPYDLLVQKNIKADVKCGKLYKGEAGDYYTFNLEKKMPTCDIFVCYCLDGDEVKKTYVIPANVLSGKTQLSIGKGSSKYDIYLNQWRILDEYSEFYFNLDRMWGN